MSNHYWAKGIQTSGSWSSVYRSVWTKVTSLVVLAGVVAAFDAFEPIAVGSLFLVGVVIGWMFTLAVTLQGSNSRSRVLKCCMYTGACVVGFMGLLAMIGGWAVCLAMVLCGCAPRLLAWVSSNDDEAGTGRRGSQGDPEVVTDLRIEPSALDNGSLCRVWHASGLALTKSRSASLTLALVCYREKCLDELERRFPFASMKWLDEGPPAGADVRTYLPPMMDRLRAP